MYRVNRPIYTASFTTSTFVLLFKVQLNLNFMVPIGKVSVVFTTGKFVFTMSTENNGLGRLFP